MKDMIEELTRYRVKIERDGKEVVNIPGILCIPGLLAAPKMSILGMVAAPLLGCNIHLVNGDGREADIEKTMQKAAESFMDTAKTTAKTIKEEFDKAWQAVSAEDEAETDDAAAAEDTAEQDAADDTAQDTEGDIPVIRVNPDDSAQA